MAWAEFVDKTKDINDATNYIQGSLRGNKPDSNQIGEYWEQNHPNWLWVGDDFKPPAPVPTKQETYASINNMYSTKLSQIGVAIQQATSRGDATVTKLQGTYTSTNSEWKSKLNAVV